MLSKEQANVIADQLLHVEKSGNSLVIDIPRRVKNTALPLFFVPLISGFFMRHVGHTGTIIMAVVGLLYLALLLPAIYQGKTPSVKIDGETWTYYGNFPWQRKHLPVSSIEKVTLSPLLNVWRNAYALTILSSVGEYQLWLSNKHPATVRQLRQLLTTKLEDKYSEAYT